MNRRALTKRFWGKVDRSGPRAGRLGRCWVWSSARDRGGYGRILLERKCRLAHRVAWLLHHGAWPRRCALHRCDNRLCVRPSHLFEGSKADNNYDRDAKGRAARLVGESNGFARLTDAKVRWARAQLSRGATQSRVATTLGVHISTISLVAKGRTWSHVR